MTCSTLGRSDEDLLAGFAASDPTASAAFVERFQRRVYGLALTVVGEPRAAEDVAQEAMVRAWRHGEAFDPRRGSVVTWLLTITRNAAIDALRVRRPVAIDPDDLIAITPPATGRDPADVVALHGDIARLRAERFQRKCFTADGPRELFGGFHRAIHDEELYACLVQQFAGPASHRRDAEDSDDAARVACRHSAQRCAGIGRCRARCGGSSAAIRVGRRAATEVQLHAI